MTILGKARVDLRLAAIVERRRGLAALIFGAIAATGFAPLELWPATLLGFAGFLWLVHRARTLKAALLTGWLFGVGHFTVNNNWIQHAFDYQDRMPPVLGYGAVVGLALYLAVYPMLAAGLTWRLGRRERPDVAYALIAGAAWIVTEWLRATMFTGYAWNPIGVVWVPVQDVASFAKLIGTYGLSGLTVVATGLLLTVPRRRRPIAFVALGLAAVGLLHSISYQQWATPWAPPENYPRLRVVQPNLDQQVHISPSYAAEKVRALAALSGRPGAAPRLILWPEGGVDAYVEDGYADDWYWRGDPIATRVQVARLLGRRDRVLTGGSALIFDKNDELIGAGNSIFVMQPDGRLGGRYDKAHLVPYGEYLPMRPLLEPLGLSRLVSGDIDFMPGPGPRSLNIPGFGKVGMQVCYEIIFSGDVVDRANRPAILFNPSNDAWFGAWGPPQHLAQARMRAIEEGLPVARSTPNGISAVIGANGRIIAQVPRHHAGAVEVPMPAADPPTLFARMGNWMAALTVAAMLVLAMILRRR